MYQSPIERVFTMLAQGNPGCVLFLAELAKAAPVDFWNYAATLTKYRLFGSRAYMLWNDACGRDINATMEVLAKIGSGRLPMSVVEAHLAEGWCRPFTPDEETEPTAPVKNDSAVAFEKQKEVP